MRLSLEEKKVKGKMNYVRLRIFLSHYILLIPLIFQSCNLDVKNNDKPLTLAKKENLDGLISECLVCHSNKEAQRGPVIHGMERWYLIDQLEKFKSGVRGQRPSNRSEYLMGVGARKIENDYQLAFLANWFAEQNPLPAIRTVQGNIEEGKEFYLQRCSSCHGENGQGNRLVNAPSLQRLEGWYFLEQMRKFRTGERGYHPSDLGGQAMAAASKEISDRNLKNVVAYSVSTFGPKEELSNREKYSPEKSKKPF